MEVGDPAPTDVSASLVLPLSDVSASQPQPDDLGCPAGIGSTLEPAEDLEATWSVIPTNAGPHNSWQERALEAEREVKGLRECLEVVEQGLRPGIPFTTPAQEMLHDIVKRALAWLR